MNKNHVIIGAPYGVRKGHSCWLWWEFDLVNERIVHIFSQLPPEEAYNE